MNLRLGLACALSMLALVAGCAYEHHAHRRDERAATKEPQFELHYVEADDDGWFWQPKQARSALQAVKDAAAAEDTIVVLFVHGWHHSAACCDGNAEGFKEVLRRLRAELEQPMYAQARERLHGGRKGGPLRIVGVYVGWRGRSLPGLVDYLTFWGRKSAAARVGRGDFREFMMRLQQVFDDHNRSASSAGSKANLLGLVSIGHSFGGHVLLDATSSVIENELQAAGREPVYLRETSERPAPRRLGRPLSGFGDLVLLINPAVEAGAYQRLHELSRAFQYDPAQAPMMLTISADNDTPRQSFFKIGRIFGEIFTLAAPKDDERERDLSRQALGVYAGQVTHRLAPVDEKVRLVASQREGKPEPYCDTSRCSFDWYTWERKPAGRADSLSNQAVTAQVVQEIETFDFSKRVTFADVVLSPLAGAIPYQPLIVASADTRVIDGHNGMFSEPLMDFLIRYIGFTEAKRLLQNAQRRGRLGLRPQ